MTASTSASSTDAYRYGWEKYANQVVSEILKMSHEERKESIDQLRLACASKGLLWEEAKSIIQYPGGKPLVPILILKLGTDARYVTATMT